MRVSLIQMESKGDKKENEIKTLKMLDDAVKENPDIICLSELFLSWGKDFNNGVDKTRCSNNIFAISF